MVLLPISEKKITIQLSEQDVRSLRVAASDRLANLTKAGMDDSDLRRLIRRISLAAERGFRIRYETKF